jgi:hypothetical protein
VFVENLFAHPEAEACANRALRRKEWLDDVLPELLADAFVVVGYSDTAVTIRGRAGRHPQLNRSSLVDGVQAVGQKIGEALTDMSAGAVDSR